MPTHFRYPFGFNSAGTADVVEQDTIEEIMQSVQIVMTTTVGERIEVPDFGIPSPVFAQASSSQASTIVRQINQHEKRAAVTLDISIDNVDQLVQHITAHVEAVSGSGGTSASVVPDLTPEPPDVGFGLGGWGVQPWGS